MKHNPIFIDKNPRIAEGAPKVHRGNSQEFWHKKRFMIRFFLSETQVMRKFPKERRGQVLIETVLLITGISILIILVLGNIDFPQFFSNFYNAVYDESLYLPVEAIDVDRL